MKTPQKGRFILHCPVGVPLGPNGEVNDNFEVDPSEILGCVPSVLLDLGNDLQVIIWDGESWFQFTVDTFMRKTYTYKKGKLRIGPKWVDADKLRVMVGALVTCVDVATLQVSGLD